MNNSLIYRQNVNRAPRRDLLTGLLSRGIVSNLADLVTLAIGLTSTLTVKFIGDLPVSEIILLTLLPIIVAMRGRRLRSPQFKIVYSLLALWLFGQVISDLYRHSQFIDWARGDAAIIFFGLDLLGLIVILSGNDRRKLIFVAGAAIGSIVVTIARPSELAQDDPWKFGYAFGVVNLVLLVSCYFYERRLYIISALLILFVASINLIENYRHEVGQLLLLIALVFPLIPERVGRLRFLSRAGAKMRLILSFGLALCAVLLAGSLIDAITSSGLLSEDAAAKNKSQRKGGSLLLGGRPEILVSSVAVMQSPIVGYGSWPKNSNYVEMLFDIQVRSGVSDPTATDELRTDLIPTHSHLMGAWVWAGILGAVFWFYVIGIVCRGIFQIALERSASAPLYAFLLLDALWNIFFSPFGLNARILDSLAIVFVCDLLHSAPSLVGTTLPRIKNPRRRLNRYSENILKSP
ncbi:hypothetical protein [Occallatibacter savannae]|uniref:hypothetical protein n=1 Tax=Occallatibacter savannae TaxID=1002691 RepID=UPI000D68AA9C|nr:hypothetical protein [Occallatibacter savannae]